MFTVSDTFFYTLLVSYYESQSDKSRRDCNPSRSPRNCSFPFSKHMNGVQAKKGLRDKHNDLREFQDNQTAILVAFLFFYEAIRDRINLHGTQKDQ